MANEPQQQTFNDFCAGVLTKIDAGEANVNDILKEATTYPEIQKYFVQHTEDINRLSTATETEALKYLRALFSEPGIFVPGPYSEGTISNIPTETTGTTSFDEVNEAPSTAQAQRKKRREFIETLVSKFKENLAEQLRQVTTTPQEVPKASVEKAAQMVEEVLVGAPLDEIVQQVEGRVAKIPELASLKPIVVAAAKKVIEKPDVVAILRQNIEEERAQATTPLTQEESVHYIQAKGVVNQIRNHPSGSASFGPAPAPATPKTTTKVTPKTVQSELVQMLTKAADDDGIIGGVMTRLGKNVATRNEVKQFIITGSQQLAQQTPSGGGAILDLVSDVVVSAKSDRSVLVDYIAASHGGHFSVIEYLHVIQQRFHPESLAKSPTGLLQWGAQIGLEKAAKATLGAGAKATAEKIGLSVGGLPGWIIAVAGTKLLEWGGKIISSTISFTGYLLSGGIISKMLEGKPASLADTFVLFPFILIGALVLLFAVPVLPFLNFADFPQTVRNTALVAPMGGRGIGINQAGAPIDCTKPPDQGGPACILTQCEGDCQWPLDSSSGACIIEGPFVGTHSSCRLSGIDFISLGGQEKLFGATVYTPYAGVVEDAVFGYLDNSGYGGNKDGGTYGNHVKVKTDKGILLFAHLRNIQLVQKGQSVSAKDPVGFVDHTGFSLGVHLHYEEWIAGCPRPEVDINKFTPFPVPPCEGYTDCQAKLQSAGHAACL